jgi:hypothetical protein
LPVKSGLQVSTLDTQVGSSLPASRCWCEQVDDSGLCSKFAHLGGGATTAVPVDEDGWFAIRPKPAGAFRLLFRGADGHVVLTEWATL